jgi:hypothetical protein
MDALRKKRLLLRWGVLRVHPGRGVAGWLSGSRISMRPNPENTARKDRCHSEEGARVVLSLAREQERRPKNLVGQRCSLSSAVFHPEDRDRQGGAPIHQILRSAHGQQWNRHGSIAAPLSE